MKRAISVDQLLKMKFTTMKFSGKFAESFGKEVQRSGSWIIYGDSGHGKTDLAIQLIKYLTAFGKIAYNSIEEGARLTFQNAINRHQFTNREQRKIIILNEEISELSERLKRPKSPDIIIVDSLQFADITKKQYKDLVRQFPNKLFIWISHADGKKPLGALAIYVEYNADIKIRVEGFRALIKSRYEATQDFIINQERSSIYWNEIN